MTVTLTLGVATLILYATLLLFMLYHSVKFHQNFKVVFKLWLRHDFSKDLTFDPIVALALGIGP